ncbi:hypothetical protein LRP52_23810, partial [Photobacterium sp. ZSDE20]|nr:hypothetical protein [Photobacterium sp. ZSDE20]
NVIAVTPFASDRPGHISVDIRTDRYEGREYYLRWPKDNHPDVIYEPQVYKIGRPSPARVQEYANQFLDSKGVFTYAVVDLGAEKVKIPFLQKLKHEINGEMVEFIGPNTYFNSYLNEQRPATFSLDLCIDITERQAELADTINVYLDSAVNGLTDLSNVKTVETCQTHHFDESQNDLTSDEKRDRYGSMSYAEYNKYKKNAGSYKKWYFRTRDAFDERKHNLESYSGAQTYAREWATDKRNWYEDTQQSIAFHLSFTEEERERLISASRGEYDDWRIGIVPVVHPMKPQLWNWDEKEKRYR